MFSAKEKELTLFYNGWEKIGNTWYKGNLINLDLDTAFMLEYNNMSEEKDHEKISG